MGFYVAWILFFVTGIYYLYSCTQPVVSFPSPPLTWTSSSGTPSHFLMSLILSCLCSLTQCLVHLFFASPVVIFQGFCQVRFHSWNPSPSCMCFLLHEPSGPCLLTWVFVLIPLLDCKLREGRDWVLLILSPFWLPSPSFSLEDNPFSHWLWFWRDGQSVLPRGCPFSGVWILSHGLHGLTVIGADSSWPGSPEEAAH